MSETDSLLQSLNRREDEEKLSFTVVVAALFSALGSINFGYAISWSSSAIPNMNEDISFLNKTHLTSSDESWIVSTLTLGAVAGTLFAAKMCDYFGRRITLLCEVFPALCGWLLIALGQNVPMLVLGRLSTGVSIGIHNTACPPFLIEISPPASRGFIGAIFQIGINLGLFIAYCMGLLFDWRVTAYIGAVFCVTMFAGLLFMKESPIWLMKNSRSNDKAIKAFMFYRNSDDINDFLNGLNRRHSTTNSILTQTETGWLTDLRHPLFYKPLFLVFFMSLAFQFSGITVICSFTEKILKDASIDHIVLGSILIGLLQVFGGIVGSIISTKLPRKGHYLITGLLTSFGLGISGASIYIHQYVTEESRLTGYLVLFCVVFTITVFVCGSGTITWAYVGELLPAHNSGLVVGAGSFTNWVTCFILTYFFNDMANDLHIYGIFYLYCFVLFLCTIALVPLPETKGKSLLEIQRAIHYSIQGD